MKRFVVTKSGKIFDLLKESLGLEIAAKSFDTLSEARTYLYLKSIGLYNLVREK